MLVLPHRNDIPHWIRQHEAITTIPPSDEQVLDLHERVCKEEIESLLVYHKLLAENPFREEIRLGHYYMINKIRKMVALVREQLDRELDQYGMIKHDSLIVATSLDSALVDEHIKRCFSYRVSAKIVHFILISHKLSLRIDLLEQELVKFKHKNVEDDVQKAYKQVTMYKEIRQTLEKYLSCAKDQDLVSLVDKIFPQHF